MPNKKPIPTKVAVCLRFSTSTIAKIKDMAAKDGRSFNNFIERLMEKEIGKKEILTHLED